MHFPAILALAGAATALPLDALSKRATDLPGPRLDIMSDIFVMPLPQGGEKATGTPKVASSAWTDTQKFYDLSGNVVDFKADLGFSGVLNGKSIWVYGDSFVNNAMVSVDASGLGRPDYPAAITLNHFTPAGTVAQLVPDTPAESAQMAAAPGSNFGFGGTHIVESTPGRGLLYYLKITRNTSAPEVTTSLGAGLAEISLDAAGAVATVTRNGDTMWAPTEPAWGDVGAARDASHVYLWGHGPGNLSDYSFMARVPLGREKEIDAYEYWLEGLQAWTPQRLADGRGGTAVIEESMAVWGWREMDQAAPFWNAHYGVWMWIYGSAWPDSDVLLATAPALQGPWTKHGTVASSVSPKQAGIQGLKYAINGHQEYDGTGKTTYVTWVVDNTVLGTILSWV